MSIPIPLLPEASSSKHPHPPRLSRASHHLASGALSGFASSVCLQPLDLLKTRIQQGGKGTGKRRIAPIFREVIREDGVRGLWRGTVPTIARNVPGVALYFYTLSELRYRLSQVGFFTAPVTNGNGKGKAPEGNTALMKLSGQGNLLAGAVARTSVGFMLNPVTVLKSRYESSLYPTYSSLPKAFRALIASHGVRGLFQGFTATALRDAPYAGIYVVFYEEGKEVASRLLKPEWGVPNAAVHSASAMSAATLATLVTSPADCIKTKMQVQPDLHPTLMNTIRTIHGDRGFFCFFSGATLRISRKAASSAIGWTVYEGLLLFLRDL